MKNFSALVTLEVTIEICVEAKNRDQAYKIAEEKADRLSPEERAHFTWEVAAIDMMEVGGEES